MPFTISIQVEAVEDIQYAFEWYELQKKGLGYSFLEEIDDCLVKLGNNPLYYGYVNKLFRKIKTNKFPFIIVYEIENNTVFITAVRHTSRKPKY